MLKSVVVVALLTICSVAPKQQTTAAQVAKFGTDVVFEPPGAWHMSYNDVCSSQDIYTTTVNATASITFIGSRIQLYGTCNSSAKYSLQIDGRTLISHRLSPGRARCGKFSNVYLMEGDHNLTIRFEGGVNDTAPEGCVNGWCPELRLTGIRYE